MGLAYLEYFEGQTPLDEDEKEGLLIPSIATRQELDEFEQQNIEQAIVWTLRKAYQPGTVFTEEFIRKLHKRMYGDVWKWAGTFRKTNKNIGVDKWQVRTDLHALLEDAIYWIENNSFSADEIAIRFKHRLVSIHCFPNGNGRHSRLMADIIVSKVFNFPVFTWGSTALVKTGEQRTAYLKGLKAADEGNIAPLVLFARS